MINEDDRKLAPAPELTYDGSAPANDVEARMRAIASEVMFIEREEWTPNSPVTASYYGTLIMDSDAAYTLLDQRAKDVNHVPLLAEIDGRQVIRLVKGRINVRPRSPLPNVILFVLTVLSLLYVGASQDVLVERLDQLLLGGPYAMGVLLILGSHELGHYFAARRHKVAVTLPYFIPMPIPGSFGTLGAFIQLREPMRNRKILLDIGAAGPLIGLLFAIPILYIGLRTSPVAPMPYLRVFTLQQGYVAWMQEGNSILYAFMKTIAFGRFLPDGMWDVTINQLAMAGWTGLLVTGLNLIPIGQLDGGHALYSLIGERARRLYLPVMVLLGAASLFYSSWAIWFVLLLLLGRTYATPFDMVTKLDTRRRVIAVLCLVVFVLVAMPIPMQIYEAFGWAR